MLHVVINTLYLVHIIHPLYYLDYINHISTISRENNQHSHQKSFIYVFIRVIKMSIDQFEAEIQLINKTQPMLSNLLVFLIHFVAQADEMNQHRAPLCLC